MTRKALGRGLSALIPGADVEAPTATITADVGGEGAWTVSIERIRPNPYQPRTVFDPEAITELADSIRANGLIQPLVVRRSGDEFELIAGERRLLACREAGITEVPVVLREAGRQEMLEVAMVENLQREDLNPMEEAEAYQRLATEFGLTQERIATRVGKSRTAVTNSLRLLTLPQEIREHVSGGILSSGHARAILSAPSEMARKKLARQIVTESLSVRQAEIRAKGESPKHRPKARKRSHPALEVFEDRLRNRFGTQVRIVGGVGRGRIELHYFNEEDLERVLTLAGIDSSL